MKLYDTIVIGAGAAGLFYGALSEPGTDSLIIDHSERPGLKLLISGSGQCNITHDGSIKDFITRYGQNGRYIRSALYGANNLSLVEFLNKNGIKTVTRDDGKIFPESLKASEILNMLIKKSEANGFPLLLKEHITDISSDDSDGTYIVKTEISSFKTKKLVIAAGGMSYPKTGSDGSLYPLIEKLGIQMIPARPALVPIYTHSYGYRNLSGISFKAVLVRLLENNREIAAQTGDILLTHRAFSGPAILDISRYADKGHKLEINYIYPVTGQRAADMIKADFQGNSRELHTYISRIFKIPDAFAVKLIENAGICPYMKTSCTEGDEITKIAEALTCHRYAVSGTGSFSEAMVTAGGVSLDEVNLRNMESKKHSNLFFIGEVLDIDGDTGGFNLQFAYSSAMAAVKNKK